MMRTWMRWSVVAASVGMGLLPGTGRAQDEAEAEAEAPSRGTVIMVQSMGLGLGLLSFQTSTQGASVEHAVGSNVALAASVSGGVRSLDPNLEGAGLGLAPSLNWGVRVDPGVHFYLSGRAPEGFWVGPHVEAAMSQYNSYGLALGQNGSQTVRTTSNVLSYGGSLRVGYTAIFSPGLTVQVGLGLGALSDRTTMTSDAPSVDIDTSPRFGWSVDPRLSVGLGWAF
ncbi:hypothetical protein [Cystobacter fuscus]|uniref:hypothetical protein n=1 Tax=Cystobacter fuscus TaxID=43 RepID=UPI002B2DE452|nr:DUF3575 domain-containing protein [Cystobacter fuscus]